MHCKRMWRFQAGWKSFWAESGCQGLSLALRLVVSLVSCYKACSLIDGRQFLRSSSPALAPPSNQLKQPLSVTAQVSGPAIPWRRQGVRHTSNELYVDIVESLSVVMAPSGRLISALVSGTIAFTAKISGVPDLLLTLSALGGQHMIARKLELPVFHPCVRLARWRERPGELSFVPPDGRFILAGYEVNLLPVDASLDKSPTLMEKLFLPAIVDIRKSLGSNGTEFEVRLTLNMNFPGAPATRIAPGGRGGSGTSTPSFLGGPSSGSSSSPTLDEVVVTVPISKYVRNIIDMHPSRGDATYSREVNSSSGVSRREMEALSRELPLFGVL